MKHNDSQDRFSFRGSLRALLVGALLALVVVLNIGPVMPAHAAFPGANGRIVFLSDREGGPGNRDIFTMNADGSDIQKINDSDGRPAWSADGTRIAFDDWSDSGQDARDIFVMNADGSGVDNVTENPSGIFDANPSWSPDGSKLVFRRAQDDYYAIVRVDVDGTDELQLTDADQDNFDPVWSPDGTRIAFHSLRDGDFQIYVMNSDGSNEHRVTTNDIPEYSVDWSPDGQKLVYTTGDGFTHTVNINGSGDKELPPLYNPVWSPDGQKIAGYYCPEPPFNTCDIYAMNADGTGLDAITTASTGVKYFVPDWGPVPASLYVSPTANGTVGGSGGVAATAQDILFRNGPANTWAMHFDGSDVGVTKAITAFARMSNGDLLLSFKANVTLPGVGAVTPWDVVRFSGTYGNTTTGTFSWYFDGSDVGLTTNAEKIDALEVLADGRVLVSTGGALSAPKTGGGTLKAQDEDLSVLNHTSLGANTAGTWAVYFDGTAVPGLKGEDVVGAHVNEATGDRYISILGAFNVGGVSGNDKDVLKLTPAGGGGYTVSLYWRGGNQGFNLNIGGVDLP